MGLDVYVGTLTRYYARDWQTVVEQVGAAKGFPVQVVRTGPDAPDRVTDPEVIRPAILVWRRQISAGLGTNLSAPLDWEEGDTAPYFTDKPAWDCYGALLVWAAHEEHPEFPPPRSAPKEWTDDPAVAASNRQGFKSRYPMLLTGVEWWLPADFSFTFRAGTPGGVQLVFGSSVELLRELDELNQRSFNADAETLEAWRRAVADSGATVVEKARFGFAVLHGLATKATAHRLPMLLDY